MVKVKISPEQQINDWMAFSNIITEPSSEIREEITKLIKNKPQEYLGFLMTWAWMSGKLDTVLSIKEGGRHLFKYEELRNGIERSGPGYKDTYFAKRAVILERDYGYTFYASGEGRTLLTGSVLLNEYSRLELFLKYGADPNISDGQKVTPLTLAIQEKDAKAIELLLKYKANPNQKDKRGGIPLFLAYAYNKECIPLLIKNGVDINTRDENGYTLLHKAIERGDKKTVSLLMQHGANPFLKNKSGKRAIDAAFLNKDNFFIDLIVDDVLNKKDPKKSNALLMLAIKNGRTDIAKKIIERVDREVLFLEDKQGWTPFLVAVKKRNHEIAALIKSKGEAGMPAIFNTKTGERALWMALKNNDYKMIDLIGWDDYRDENGKTAWHYAVEQGCNAKTLSTLSKYSSAYQMHITDNAGRTPLDYAKSASDVWNMLDITNQGYNAEQNWGYRATTKEETAKWIELAIRDKRYGAIWVWSRQGFIDINLVDPEMVIDGRELLSYILEYGEYGFAKTLIDRYKKPLPASFLSHTDVDLYRYMLNAYATKGMEGELENPFTTFFEKGADEQSLMTLINLQKQKGALSNLEANRHPIEIIFEEAVKNKKSFLRKEKKLYSVISAMVSNGVNLKDLPLEKQKELLIQSVRLKDESIFYLLRDLLSPKALSSVLRELEKGTPEAEQLGKWTREIKDVDFDEWQDRETQKATPEDVKKLQSLINEGKVEEALSLFESKNFEDRDLRTILDLAREKGLPVLVKKITAENPLLVNSQNKETQDLRETALIRDTQPEHRPGSFVQISDVPKDRAMEKELADKNKDYEKRYTRLMQAIAKQDLIKVQEIIAELQQLDPPFNFNVERDSLIAVQITKEQFKKLDDDQKELVKSWGFETIDANRTPIYLAFIDVSQAVELCNKLGTSIYAEPLISATDTETPLAFATRVSVIREKIDYNKLKVAQGIDVDASASYYWALFTKNVVLPTTNFLGPMFGSDPEKDLEYMEALLKKQGLSDEEVAVQISRMREQQKSFIEKGADEIIDEHQRKVQNAQKNYLEDMRIDDKTGPSIVQTLITAGADVNAQTQYRERAISYAIEARDTFGITLNVLAREGAHILTGDIHSPTDSVLRILNHNRTQKGDELAIVEIFSHQGARDGDVINRGFGSGYLRNIDPFELTKDLRYYAKNGLFNNFNESNFYLLLATVDELAQNGVNTSSDSIKQKANELKNQRKKLCPELVELLSRSDENGFNILTYLEITRREMKSKGKDTTKLDKAIKLLTDSGIVATRIGDENLQGVLENTPLVRACNSKADIAGEMIGQNGNSSGRTILHDRLISLIETKDVEQVKAFLEDNPNFNLNTYSEKGVLPLERALEAYADAFLDPNISDEQAKDNMLAAKTIIQLLIKNGAYSNFTLNYDEYLKVDVTKKGEKGYATAVGETITRRNEFYYTNAAEIEEMLSNAEKGTVFYSENGQPYMQALRALLSSNDKKPHSVRTLVLQGIDAYSPDLFEEKNGNVLHILAEYGISQTELKSLKDLKKLDPERYSKIQQMLKQQNANGETPIDVAARAGRLEMVQFFLTEFNIQLEPHHLPLAIKNRVPVQIIKLLIERTTNLSGKQDYRTALELADASYTQEIFEFMLESGKKLPEGYLYYALKKRLSPEIIDKFLKKAKKDKKASKNKQEEMIFAVSHDKYEPELIKKMLAQGYPINVSVLEQSLKTASDEVVILLWSEASKDEKQNLINSVQFMNTDSPFYRLVKLAEQNKLTKEELDTEYRYGDKKIKLSDLIKAMKEQKLPTNDQRQTLHQNAQENLTEDLEGGKLTSPLNAYGMEYA